MPTQVVRDPHTLALPPPERALAGLATLLTEAPWLVEPADLARLRDAGLADAQVVQAVTIVAQFNYFTRMADATGIEFDYDSPLPRIAVDPDRAALERPARADFVHRGEADLSLRPASAEAFARLRAYVMDRDAALSRRDRAVIAFAAACACADGVTTDALEAPPRDAREGRLAAFAAKLSVSPWRMNADDVAELHEDDRTVLDLASVVAAQNLFSRLRLALGAAR